MKKQMFKVLIVLSAALTVYAKPDDTTPNGTKERPYILTAKELLQAWKDNEIKAEAKYKNKWVTVSGTITKIHKSFGTPIVSLAGLSDFSSVSCRFTKADGEKLAELEVGDEFSAKGICGGVLMGGATLKDCVFTPVPKTD